MNRKSLWCLTLDDALVVIRLRRWLLRSVLLAALLWLIFSTVDLDSAVTRLRQFDTRYLWSMFAVNLLVIVISAYRWFLLGVVADVRAPWTTFLRTTWVSWAIAECGPTFIASEASRYWLMRGRADPMRLAATQFADRLSGYLALLALTVILTIGGRPIDLSFATSAVFSAAVAGLGALAALAAPRGLWRVLDDRVGRVSLVRTLLAAPIPHLLSLTINLLFAINLMLAGKAIGLGGDGLAVFLLAPMILSATVSLPSVVSDWGKREAAAMLVLHHVGIASEDSLAMSLAYGVVNMTCAMPGLLGLLSRTKARVD